MYRKKTLRNMAPITRRYARNINSLQGIIKRLQNLTEDVARLESDRQALFNQRRHQAQHALLPQQEDDDEL